MQTQTKWIPFAAMMLGGFAQGASYSITKKAGGLPPLGFLFWSLVGSTALLFALALARRALPPLNARTLEFFIASGALTVAFGWMINVLTAPRVGASFISLTVALVPLMTYAAAAAAGLDTATRRRSTGVALALVGAVALAWSRLSVPDAPVGWTLLALAMPFCLTAGNIYRSMRWPPGAGALALTLGMVAAAVVWVAFAAVVFGRSLSFPAGGGVMVGLQSVALAGQFLALLVLLKHGGVVFQSLMAATAALLGVVIAVAGLGEAVPGAFVLSAALIVAGVAVTGLGRGKA